MTTPNPITALSLSQLLANHQDPAIAADPSVQARMTELHSLFSTPSHSTPVTPLGSCPPLALALSEPSNPIAFNVKVNSKVKVHSLYFHPRGSVVEYPQTDLDKNVGHLFEMDPSNWINPALDFAYSRGPPEGQLACTVQRLRGAVGAVQCIRSFKTCM